MDALLMCGGRGTRLDASVEKPLFEVAGRPMVDRVVDALTECDAVEAPHAAVSPATPETAVHLRERGDVTVLETSGEGYVADLDAALDAVGRPAVTVAADLPLLAPVHVERAVRAAETNEGDDRGGRDPASVSVLVPAVLKERLGVSTDEAAQDGWVPTGLNVVGGEGEHNGGGADDGRPEEGDSGTATDGGTVCVRRTWDARLAVNVNHKRDAEAAESLLHGS